ncbi:hypothetical protein [Methylorubrum zatmanii]
MAHTNISMPTSSDTAERHNHAILKADRDFWQREAERLADEMRNISEAVERHGYVTIDYRGEPIRLVAESSSGEEA